MSGQFSAKYTDDQRDAIASAVLDRGAKYKRAIELAAAGELTTPEGEKLAPFTFAASYVGTIVDREKRRRIGAKTTRAGLEPRDAVEVLRRELVDVMDSELRHLRKTKAGSRDPEKLRQFARALRELQAIPGPKDRATPAPGAKANGTQHGGQTKGGLAGDILKAHRNDQGSTAPETHTETKPTTENGDAAKRSAQDDEDEGTKDGERPGSLARAIAARHLSTA